MRPPRDDLEQELPKVGVYDDDPPCDVFLDVRRFGSSPGFTLLGIGGSAAHTHDVATPQLLKAAVDKRRERAVLWERWQVIVNPLMLALLRDDARFTP